MASEDVQTNLRLPSELKDKLQASAEAHGRSLSAEVAYRVEQAFRLEAAEAETVANIRAARELVDNAQTLLIAKDRELAVAQKHVADSEAQLDLIKKSRESDIAAATKFLADRTELLAARAGSAEREAQRLSEAIRSQEIMVRALAQFIVTQGKLSSPEPGTETIHEHMQQAALAVAGGDHKSAVQAVIALTPLLDAYVHQMERTKGDGAKKKSRTIKP